MQKFLFHDGIAAGIFNKDYHGAQASSQPWKRFLQNTDELLSLLLCRMEKDWVSLAPKMRKPYGQKELEPWLSW